MARRDEEFSQLYTARAAVLRRTAFLLCGDWHLAEDLVQTAFVKLYLAWHRIERVEQLDGYVRRIIVRNFLDEKRRPWRRVRVTDTLPEQPAPERGDLGERMLLGRALASLPRRQRATLVLRFWEDLSVEETARVLEMSTGTVKSYTARGLQALRTRLGDSYPMVMATEAGQRD